MTAPISIACRHCGKRFSAWADLLGSTVKCPKCGRSMTIPEAGLKSDSPTTKEPSRPTHAPGGAGEAETRSPAPTASPRAVKVSSPRKPSSARTSPPPAASSTGTPAQDDRPVEAPTGSLPCPNCKAPMPGGDDLCDECGYHLILRKVLDLSDVRRREDGSGFEKVLKRQLQEGSSAENVLFWAKFLGFFGLLFFSLMCFFPWGIFLFAAGVVAYLFFRHRLAKQRDGSDSSINQDPVSIAVWSGVLFVQRAVGWRKPAWPFPPVHVLTVRDSEFGDEDLAELEELKEVAGVDMEGTNVSDAGLTHLQGLRNLRFVVVRRTRVTAPGAARLQTTLPDAWIWR